MNNTIKDTLVELLRDAKAELKLVERERDKFHEDADAFLDKMSKAQERAIDAERERDEAHERADTMFVKHAEILDQYRRERDAERALADRLAEVLDYYYSEDSRHHIASNRAYARAAWSALAAWKEARND